VERSGPWKRESWGRVSVKKSSNPWPGKHAEFAGRTTHQGGWKGEGWQGGTGTRKKWDKHRIQDLPKKVGNHKNLREKLRYEKKSYTLLLKSEGRPLRTRFYSSKITIRRVGRFCQITGTNCVGHVQISGDCTGRVTSYDLTGSRRASKLGGIVYKTVVVWGTGNTWSFRRAKVSRNDNAKGPAQPT